MSHPEERTERRSICCLTPGLGLVGPNRSRAQVAFVSDPQPTGVVAHLNDPTRPPPVEHLHAAPRGEGMTDSHHRCPHAE